MPKVYKTRNLRISLVPSDRLKAVVDRLSEVSGESRASICAELLDEAVPVLEDMLHAYEQVAKSPERMKEFVEQLAKQGQMQIAQALHEVQSMDLPLERPDLRKAHHKREASRGRQRA